MFLDIAFAAEGLDPYKSYEITDIIRIGIAVVILVSGMLSIFFILWGGLMLILSGGKDDKVKPAINSIRFSILGLVVVVLSVFIAPKLGDLLGLNVSKYVSPNAIFTTLKTVSNRIFGTNSSSSDVNLNSTDPNTTLPSDFSDL